MVREHENGKEKKMKDSNNSDKVSCSPPACGAGDKNLFEQHREKHIVQSGYGGPFVLYINKHCPQQVAAAYYYVPTHNQQLPIKDKLSRLQLQSLFEKNTSRNNLAAPVYSYKNNMAVSVVA